MRKIVSLLLALTLIFALLTGCGGKNDGSDIAQNGEGASEAYESSAPEEEAASNNSAQTDAQQGDAEEYVLVREKNQKIYYKYLYRPDGTLAEQWRYTDFEMTTVDDYFAYTSYEYEKLENGGWIYTSRWRGPDGSLLYEEEYTEEEYDADGNMVRHTDMKGDSISSQYLRTYDAEGHLLRSETTDGMGTGNVVDYEYDENGFLIKETRSNGGEIGWYTTYENDEYGHHTREIEWKPDGTVEADYGEYHWVHNEDEQGRIIEEYMQGDIQKLDRYEYAYDENGRLVQEKKSDVLIYYYGPLSEALVEE